MVIIGNSIDEVRVDGRLGQMENDLRHFEAIGLQAAEIPTDGVDAIIDGKLDMRRLGQVKDVLQGFELKYSVHAPIPLNLMDADKALHMNVMHACLSFCEEIGSHILVYHPGRFLAEEEFPVRRIHLSARKRELLMEAEVEDLRAIADEYKDVCICMETARPYLKNSPYCYAEQPGMLLQQAHNIDRKNVRITLDLGHAYMASRLYGFDPVKAASDMGPMIAHTHVHDNFGRSIYQHEKQQTHLLPFGRGDMHMPVGRGCIPIKDILASYARHYKGIYMMELRSRYFANAEESFNNLSTIARAIEEDVYVSH